MKKIFIIISMSMFSVLGFAQDGLDNVLFEIEKNNLELRALRSQTEADKYGLKAEGKLEDPEVGFNYLWSNADEGPRRDFSVTQTLDAAVLFGANGRLNSEKMKLMDYQLNVDRQRILLEAKQLCLNLIYYNAMARELSVRLDHAAKVNENYARMLEEGQVNRKEANDARMAWISLQGQFNRNALEAEALRTELQRLNGGIALDFDVASFGEEHLLPEDFEAWYEEMTVKSPVLAFVDQNVKVMERQKKAQKMSNYPKLTAGYMSEVVPANSFRGMTFGISIPLWSVRSSVRQANASYEAAKLQKQDLENQYYTQMKSLFARTLSLQEVVSGYTEAVEVAKESSTSLRENAHAGEISMVDQLVELGVYYDVVDSWLEAERDYRLALAELESFML